MLGTIERATKQKIPTLTLPSVDEVNQARVERFKQKVIAVTNSKNIETFKKIYTQLRAENDIDENTIGAALAMLSQGNRPLFLQDHHIGDHHNDKRKKRDRKNARANEHATQQRSRKPRSSEDKPAPGYTPKALPGMPEVEMQRFRLQVGNRNGVKPGNIVGAIANEADIESKYIGTIEIREDFSTIDLPSGMPKSVFKLLKKTRVAGRPLGIEFYEKESSKPKSNAKNKRKSRNHSSRKQKKRTADKNRKTKNRSKKKKK